VSKIKGFTEFQACSLILSEQSRADRSIVNGDEPITVGRLLRMLTVVKVTQVVLLPFEEDDSQAVQSKRAADLIVHYTGTQVKSLVVLASCRQVSLLL
jgi:hypothetical protein